jgi:hypothetical protein
VSKARGIGWALPYRRANKHRFVAELPHRRAGTAGKARRPACSDNGRLHASPAQDVTQLTLRYLVTRAMCPTLKLYGWRDPCPSIWVWLVKVCPTHPVDEGAQNLAVTFVGPSSNKWVVS